MAIETLDTGFENGYDWILDHDEVAGTLGITVTDNGSPPAGALLLHAEITPGTVNFTDTIAPVRLDPFDGQGRQILYANGRLKNIVLVVAKGQTPPVVLTIWTTFQPSG